MGPKLAAAGIGVLAAMVSAPAEGCPPDEITVSIAKHARLTVDGAVVIAIDIRCGPLPGVEEFQEAFAGAAQALTGAEAEGGIDGSLICDGVRRRHSARLSPFTDERFRRGPATANTSLFVCQLLGDEQQCFSASAQRRIVATGRALP